MWYKVKADKAVTELAPKALGILGWDLRWGGNPQQSFLI